MHTDVHEFLGMDLKRNKFTACQAEEFAVSTTGFGRSEHLAEKDRDAVGCYQPYQVLTPSLTRSSARCRAAP